MTTPRWQRMERIFAQTRELPAHTRAEVVARVPAAAFEPAPKVDSAVLRLERRHDPPIPPGEERDPFYRVVQAGFRQRRKMVHNGLGRELPLPAGALDAALAAQVAEGNRLGITSTPTVYIDGKKLPQINYFVAVVDKEARKKGSPPLAPAAH